MIESSSQYITSVINNAHNQFKKEKLEFVQTYAKEIGVPFNFELDEKCNFKQIVVKCYQSAYNYNKHFEHYLYNDGSPEGKCFLVLIVKNMKIESSYIKHSLLMEFDYIKTNEWTKEEYQEFYFNKQSHTTQLL